MGRYRYRAMNSDNEKIEGKYDAKSKDEVVEFIASNGMYPLLVEEIVQSKDVKFGVNRKVKVKDIAIMSRQFYTMLEAGVPILECLNILSNQIENNKLRQCITEIAADVNKGGVLSELDLCQYSRHIFLVFLSRFCNKIFIILWSHITNSAMNSFSVIPTFNILKY